MGDAYKIATKVPWEDAPRDWSHKFNRVDGVLNELHDRAENHRGQRFVERVRGKGTFGMEQLLGLTVDAARHDLVQGTFGELVQVRSEKDHVEWWIRKLKDFDPPTINLSEANYHIDALYTSIFKTNRSEYPGIENWGTCNRRTIAGTSEWSQHCPWLPGSHTGSGGCNAIDCHASHDVMYKLSRDIAGKTHVAKILFYRMEWTPETGWINVPSIGTSHDDHVHIEGPRDHGGLASACNY